MTGANSGAGFAATKILLSKGETVVMLNRNETKSAQAINEIKAELGTNVKVSFFIMDLSELASVRKAAAEVITKVSKIDALIAKTFKNCKDIFCAILEYGHLKSSNRLGQSLIIIAACAIGLLFFSTPSWRASLITAIAMLVVILLIDGTAHARIDAYNQ
ncbi:MAG: SDR family NAD(P)-dependent oxidoreductase [Bacteroidota bacterium]